MAISPALKNTDLFGVTPQPDLGDQDYVMLYGEKVPIVGDDLEIESLHSRRGLVTLDGVDKAIDYLDMEVKAGNGVMPSGLLDRKDVRHAAEVAFAGELMRNLFCAIVAGIGNLDANGAPREPLSNDDADLLRTLEVSPNLRIAGNRILCEYVKRMAVPGRAIPPLLQQAMEREFVLRMCGADLPDDDQEAMPRQMAAIDWIGSTEAEPNLFLFSLINSVSYRDLPTNGVAEQA